MKKFDFTYADLKMNPWKPIGWCVFLTLILIIFPELGKEAVAQDPVSTNSEPLPGDFELPEKFKVPEQEPPRKAPRIEEEEELVSHELLVRYKTTSQFQRKEANKKWFAAQSVGARALSRPILSNQKRVMDQMGEKLREKYKKEYKEDVFIPREDFSLLGIQVVEIPNEKVTKELYAKVREEDDVDSVMLNYRAYPLSHWQAGDLPKDEFWVEHAKPPKTHAVLWGLEKIQMHKAWEKAGSWNGVSTENIIVAVIDSGIKKDHPDLASNLWVNQDDIHGVNFLATLEETKCDKNQKINDLDDEIDHGTAVSGVIAAAGSRVGGNGSGIVGVHGNGEVKIMTLKMFCKCTSCLKGVYTDTKAIVGAIEYSMEMKAHIINASWTMAVGLPENQIVMLREAIRDANDQGVLFVAAAGNSQDDHEVVKVYPSSFDLPNVLAVAATHVGDALRTDSDWGKETVHLAAPGNLILTTSIFPPGTKKQAGTSIAAPFVTGCAAFLQSQRKAQGLPLLSPLELKDTMMKSVIPLDALKEKVKSGGSLNCFQAYIDMTPSQ